MPGRRTQRGAVPLMRTHAAVLLGVSALLRRDVHRRGPPPCGRRAAAARPPWQDTLVSPASATAHRWKGPCLVVATCANIH